MKSLIPVLLAVICIIGSTFPKAYQLVDYSDIGIVLEIPDSWESSFFDKLTKSENASVMGRTYEAADSNSIYQASFIFMELDVDSTLLPEVEAYDFHKLAVNIYGFYGWYDRSLWSLGRSSLLKRFSAYSKKQ